MQAPVQLDDLSRVAAELEEIAKYLRTRKFNDKGRGQPNANPFVDILGSRDFGDPMQSYIAQVGRE